MEKKKYRIGVIIDAIHEQYQSGIWKGIVHQANACGVNLLSFVGTSQDGVDHFDTQYDLIQQFAIASDIDGVIVFSGSITEHHGRDFTAQLCDGFSGLPLVCLSERIGEHPCIVVENAPGIEQMVDHFVSVHNLRNIAFIKGPAGHAEAEERFNAYQRSLTRNSIAFQPELIFEGSFISRDGALAVRNLVAKGAEFDGIIAVNDHTAFGVLEELNRSGLHVPGSVSVAGFDDVLEAAEMQPALTTVRQPLFLMGKTAVDHVIAQIKGETVSKITVLPTEPVFRRSCGCFSESVKNAKSVHTRISGFSVAQVVEHIAAQTHGLIDRNSPAYPGDEQFKLYLSDLVNALVWDVQKPAIRNIFLNEVDILLFNVSKFCDSVNLLQTILRELTICATSQFENETEQAEVNNLLQQGAALVLEYRTRNEHRAFMDDNLFQRTINVVSQRLISSFEQRELLESIAKGLPSLHVDNMVLAVFQQGSVNRCQWKYSSTCDLLLAYNKKMDKVLYPRSSMRVNSAEIVVKELFEDDHVYNQVFMPLYYRDEYLGYVVMEYSPQAPLFMYEELRLHISSAIKSSLLLRKFKAQSMLDELTGVYNRRGFMTLGNEMLDTARNQDMQLMMFYADVDGLKVINDVYGHEDGDIIISGAATVLTETFRERDLIARIGGDEFVVALTCHNTEGLESKIRKRFSLFEDKFNEKLNKEYRLSVSLGAAICRMSKGETLERLMKRADADLFGKKRARKLSL